MYEKTKTLITEHQVSQVCQVAGRNVELMFICFVISNITKTQCDDDIKKTFEQKLIEEGERTELGFIGLLRETLSELWTEKQGNSEYLTEAGQVKISNKEIYSKYNAKLRKENAEGISPAKFKEYMLEFGFTDALNRVKLEVPIPGEPEPKSRLCNIFTDRVLRKIGVEAETDSNAEKPPESHDDNTEKTKPPEGAGYTSKDQSLTCWICHQLILEGIYEKTDQGPAHYDCYQQLREGQKQ